MLYLKSQIIKYALIITDTTDIISVFDKIKIKNLYLGKLAILT